ncbi:MAG TPA: RNA helicase, partial [Lachnospiraceae bacterium]|nr:RNA helicase [Lachnospiraceae bacterium]
FKEQLNNIKQIVTNTKTANLWSHEAAIRKKLKAMTKMQGENIKGYGQVYEEYRELLDDISIRLLDDYNKKNKTDFVFDKIVRDNLDDYVKSGIMTVLVTSHIPKIVADDFDLYIPDKPKDDYIEARRLKRMVYLHLGETNTGKTYEAIERLKVSDNGIYLAPLRILALEIYERLNESDVACNLVTGEEEIIIEGAKHQSCTVEKLNIDQNYKVAVIDEIQMLGDNQRGAAWTRALLGLKCPEIHVCGALNAKDLVEEILQSCEDKYEIKEYVRNVPLQIEEKPFDMKEVKEGDALIVFSKKRVLEIAKMFKDNKVETSMIYGDLPPEVRKIQYRDFIDGRNKILVSTDAIGMGVNLPIRRIIFMNSKKFDGDEIRTLTSQEIKQIAGRAGRKGIYEIGYVASTKGQYEFMKRNIEKRDDPLIEAVVGPGEVLLKIKALPLRDKLALWATREDKVPLYKKMDIRDYILILDNIKRYKLEEEVEWRLMRLPFDVHNERVFETFIDYVEQYFIRKNEAIYKPVEDGKSLEASEIYYQKINLYYSFAKNFKIPFEEEWVYDERKAVSERINQLLISGRFSEL